MGVRLFHDHTGIELTGPRVFVSDQTADWSYASWLSESQTGHSEVSQEEADVGRVTDSFDRTLTSDPA